MKLIFLIPDLHLWGGGERVAVQMANHYASKGMETILLSVGTQGGDFRFEIDPDVKVEYLDISLKSTWKLARRIEAIFAIRAYFHQTIPMVFENDGRNSQTILFGMGTFPMILASAVSGRGRLKRIGCQHSTYLSIKHIWKLLSWLCYRRLDILVSLTYRDLPRLRKHHPVVKVIPNPVPFYPEQPAKLTAKLILAVGRIDYLKGYDMMIEVFRAFCKKNLEWNLKIIGDGPLKAEIEKLARDKGVAHRIIFSPPSSQIEKQYLESSILLMTSRSEGLPMVLLEAQACGLPIVAFDCEAGPAEIVDHGIDGYLVRPYDIEQMSQYLLELTSDPEKRKSFGAAARENVKRFSPDKIFAKWDELFNQLQKTAWD
jgi:glycosyltransferase involved in cell wall biosynthesis